MLFTLKKWPTFLTLIFICEIINRSSSSVSSNSSNKNEILKLPQLYLLNKMRFCSINSAHRFSNEIALQGIDSMLEEGTIFFGLLMDNLEKSMEESDEMSDDLKNKWGSLTESILDSFDLTTNRLKNLWVLLGDRTSTLNMPWEKRSKHQVENEILSAIGHEYLMIGAIVKSGVREIISTLQGYLGKLIKKLETKAFGDNPDMANVNISQVMIKMEEMIEEVDPSFIGSLLVKMFRRSKERQKNTNNPSSSSPLQDSFISRELEEIAILIEAFRNRGNFGNFWLEMTKITLEEREARKILSPQQVFHLYKSSPEFVLNTLLTFI